MARRGQNEGTIHKRSDGRWVGTLSLGYEGGKRKRKSFYGKTRREAQEKLTRALKDVQDQRPLQDEKLRLGAFLDQWLAEVVKPSVRWRTHQSYEEVLRLHVRPTLGGVTLAKLNPRQIQRLLNDKLASGLSPRRVRYIYEVLKRALSQAVRWGIVARNVAALATPPKVEQREMEPFTPDEARRFLEAVRGDRFEALYTVTLSLGMRQGEALGLKWSDIDLNAGTLKIRRSLSRAGKELVFVEPKTERSRRTIALPQIAADALRAHRAKQNAERLAAGAKWEDQDLVFPTRAGKPVRASDLIKRFKKALRKAGLREIRFHDLRHTAATLLLVQGVHPRVVMEILGHSNVGMTLNTYSHVVPELRLEAAGKMDAVLGSAAPPG